MPVVKPVSDLQRNLSAVSAECHESGEPIYLTKNGSATLVVMDAAAFDSRLAILDRVSEHEERVARSIARGYDDLVNGRTRPWAQAKLDADRIRKARNGG